MMSAEILQDLLADSMVMEKILLLSPIVPRIIKIRAICFSGMSLENLILSQD